MIEKPANNRELPWWGVHQLSDMDRFRGKIVVYRADGYPVIDYQHKTDFHGHGCEKWKNPNGPGVFFGFVCTEHDPDSQSYGAKRTALFIADFGQHYLKMVKLSPEEIRWIGDKYFVMREATSEEVAAIREAIVPDLKHTDYSDRFMTALGLNPDKKKGPGAALDLK